MQTVHKPSRHDIEILTMPDLKSFEGQHPDEIGMNPSL